MTTYCQRCGLDRRPLSTVTVERPDGQQLTINACDPCQQALRAMKAV
jgi:hypothetical protein